MTEKISKESAIKFLYEAAKYFKKRRTNGEDMAYWANIYNSENCIKIAKMIEGGQPEMIERRWLCEECEKVCLESEILSAPNPFSEFDTVTYCPHCFSAERLTTACWKCDRRGSSGSKTDDGYVWSCWDHIPDWRKFPHHPKHKELTQPPDPV